MQALAELVGYFAILFAVAVGMGFWVSQRKLGRPVKSLPAGCVVRVKSGSHLYRSRFVEANGNGWVFSAPLSRDRFIPLTIGERIVVETSRPEGLLVFETEVLSRAMHPHTFTVRMPELLRPVNRRREARISGDAWPEVWLGPTPGQLLDVSGSGARVLAGRRIEIGTPVTLRLECAPEPVEATVVGCDTVCKESTLRLRFLHPISLPAPS